MSIREKRLALAEVTTSDVAVYTCPDAKVATIKDFDVCNSDGSSVGFYAYIVPSGDTPTIPLCYNLTIYGNGNAQWTGTQVLEAGDALYVKGSAAGLSITCSGVERDL